MAQTVLHDDERGFVIAEGNELTIGSKIDDPPKLRLTSPFKGGGYISFNFSEESKVQWGSNQTEMGMIGVTKADGASLPAGELHFFLNDGGREDKNMRRVASWIWNKLTSATFSWGSRSDTIWAPNGLTFTQQQDDGNFVTYTVKAPFDKSAGPKAVWSAWTGFIG